MVFFKRFSVVLFAVCFFWAAFLATQGVAKEEKPDKRLRYGQVEMVTPEGYVEVPVDSPYYSHAAFDAALLSAKGLVRLFIPEEELPFLQSQQFNSITQNIQVMLYSQLEDAPSAFIKEHMKNEEDAIKELKKDLKINGVVEKGKDVTDAMITQWLERSSLPKHDPSDSFLFGMQAYNHKYLLMHWLGKDPIIKHGLPRNSKIALAMLSYCTEDRAVTLLFTQIPTTAADVHAVKARAMKYMSNNADSIRVVPALTNPLLEGIINKGWYNYLEDVVVQ